MREKKVMYSYRRSNRDFFKEKITFETVYMLSAQCIVKSYLL